MSDPALKVLRIDTAFPTVVGTPEDAGEADLVEVETKTRVYWPDNWHKLSPRWRAVLLTKLVHKVVATLLQSDTATFAEFQKLTGWGTKAGAK